MTPLIPARMPAWVTLFTLHTRMAPSAGANTEQLNATSNMILEPEMVPLEWVITLHVCG
jgi:hypothetical protein